MKKYLIRGIKILLLSVLVLLITGTLYEQVSQFYFDKKKPSANEFVSIDGKALHFVKKGSGGPTVVFQSGLGGDYKIWEQIQDSLSEYSTTISYDRAGLQWSETTGKAKSMDQFTTELEQLLEKTNCPKPYILVGHSLAGLTLRPFIAKHPEDIKGVVFLDVSHPLQIRKSSEALKQYLVVPPTWFVGALIETGVARSYYHFKPFVAGLPAQHPMNRHVARYFYKSYQTFLDEARADDQIFDEAAKITSFGTIPLTIITGTYPNGASFLNSADLEREYLEIHRAGQKDLLNLSDNSNQIFALNSDHYVPLKDPALVIRSVIDIINDKKQ